MAQYLAVGRLHNNSFAMHTALVYEYLTAGGMNPVESVPDMFKGDNAIMEMAMEAWDGWRLDENNPDDGTEPFDFNELRDAFEYVRDNLNEFVSWLNNGKGFFRIERQHSDA